jgi:hypothetical protein
MVLGLPPGIYIDFFGVDACGQIGPLFLFKRMTRLSKIDKNNCSQIMSII